MSAILSVLFLSILAISGVLALARARLELTRLELMVYGVAVGNIFWSLTLLALATLVGSLSVWLVIAMMLAAAGVSVALWRAGADAELFPNGVPRWPPAWRSSTAGIIATPTRARRANPKAERRSLGATIRRALAWPWFWPVVVIVGFTLRWIPLWAGMFQTQADGLYVGQINVWGDWPQHVGDTTSFAYGDNFPPEHPRFAGVPYAYHYLASFSGSAMVKLGMDPFNALSLHSFLFSVVIALALLAFGLRIAKDHWVAALSVVLFMLGGNLGWLLQVQAANGSNGVLSGLWNNPWDVGRQKSEGFWWENFFFTSVEPQRSVLYGLPLTLLVLTLLYLAVQRRGLRWFVAAGVALGLMPFAHLGPLPALAITIPFIALLFPAGSLRGPIREWYPWRGWFTFGAIAVALVLPQVLLQQYGQPIVDSGFRFHVGWLRPEGEALWFFWLKNLGFFIPLIVIGLALPRLLGSVSYRFLWAFMPIFVVCNLVSFQVDPLDNTKTFLYWWVAACILVAAVIVSAWRHAANVGARVVITLVVATMLFSGVLWNVHQARGMDHFRWLTTEEIAFAEQVRAETPTDAVFATSTRHDHPVHMLTGRQVVTSFWGWLYTRGFDTSPRDNALRQIYALGPDAPAAMAQYDVAFVVIGPSERNTYQPDEALWRATYPVVIETENYQVFDVRDITSASSNEGSTSMLVLLSSTLLIIAFGAPGVVALARTRLGLTRLELVVYGGTIGVVVMTLVLLGMATIAGLTTGLVIGVAVLAVGLAVGLRGAPTPTLGIRATAIRPTWAWPRVELATVRALANWRLMVPSLVVALVIIRLAFYWGGAVTTESDGIYAGEPSIWADWALHMGDVTNFTSGDNFPPTHPRLAGDTGHYSYNYLPALTAAAMVKVGMSQGGALAYGSFLFTTAIALGIVAFAFRLTRHLAAAALSVALFFAGGGLGWIVIARDRYDLSSLGALISSLRTDAWDQGYLNDQNFAWPVVFFTQVSSQRGHLYGVPLTLLILTLLLIGSKAQQRRHFIVAGLAAGLLPLSHLGMMLALALAAPFLALALFPWRQALGVSEAGWRAWRPSWAELDRAPFINWLLFAGVWVVLAVPQVLIQQGGAGAAGSTRIQWGWVAEPDNWLWFWTKNLGPFLAVLLIGLVWRGLFASLERRLLLALMSLFVIPNILVFQPWDQDNMKVFILWYLVGCIVVSAAVVGLWRIARAAPLPPVLLRGALILVVAAMLLSGSLQHLSQALGQDRYRWLSADEVRIAETLRNGTPPDVVFAANTRHNSPILMLSGRKMMLGYLGWMWTYGIDSSQRERDLYELLQLGEGTDAIIERYGLDYVVIGPGDDTTYQADRDGYLARYPLVLQDAGYEVFAVSDRAIDWADGGLQELSRR